MSEKNVEVAQASFDAWNAGDLDAYCALHDPNVIWAGLEGWPEAETLVGLEACRRQWERMRAGFEADTAEPIGDPVAIGDRVVQRFRWRGTGQGPEMNMDMTAVLTLRKGKIFIIENFWDHAEALEAIGLTE
ncbi:MAG: nuclear transport factor 2 family protein [Thermoleophilaceae bacterium]